jgi:hypothetical protein
MHGGVAGVSGQPLPLCRSNAHLTCDAVPKSHSRKPGWRPESLRSSSAVSGQLARAMGFFNELAWAAPMLNAAISCNRTCAKGHGVR